MRIDDCTAPSCCMRMVWELLNGGISIFGWQVAVGSEAAIDFMHSNTSVVMFPLHTTIQFWAI